METLTSGFEAERQGRPCRLGSGKEGILSRVFGHTLEKLLEAERTSHLGYDKYEAAGRLP